MMTPTTPMTAPTFWPLDALTGWRSLRDPETSRPLATCVSVDGVMRLDAIASGPLGLTSSDRSLGGLTFPRGMALDSDGTLYLLGVREPRVLRFDAARRAFVPLPGLGGWGEAPGRFRWPQNIAIVGRDLYVADLGNRRVQVFALPSLVLRHVWGRRDSVGHRSATGEPGWRPWDVAASGGAAYILDWRHGRVYRHRPGIDRLDLIIDAPAAQWRWTRLALDRDGRLYLLDALTRHVAIYDADGRFLNTTTDAGEIRDRFDPPPLRILDDGATGRFCLPAELARPCDRRHPSRPPAPETPLALCPPSAPDSLIFDREGRRLTGDLRLVGPKLYTAQGCWYSEALDSGIERCQWHRIELELADLPVGSQVEVSTFTADDLRAPTEIVALHTSAWETSYTVVGQAQRPPDPGRRQPGVARNGAGDAPRTIPPIEFLVQSLEGRYLWLRVTLRGDGYGTPAVRSLRVHYPRDSYLQYLPAVYAEDQDSRRFLERLLAIFQTEWDDLERRVEEVAAYFDPAAVPAEGGFLDYLAGWLALPLEGDWTPEQRRRLLVAAREIYPRRGTAAGLRAYLQVYLQNLAGIAPADQGEYPQLVEAFRERHHALLAQKGRAELGAGLPVWSAGVVGRLQADVYAREGEVRLVSTGDPQRDVFHEYAHRFRVFMPADWVCSAADERMLRRALDAEKPAHTAYELCLVEPRFRVGVQASVGLDTILGGYPEARLACSHGLEQAPSLPPRHRLGYDSVIACAGAGGPAMKLTPGVRVGAATILT